MSLQRPAMPKIRALVALFVVLALGQPLAVAGAPPVARAVVAVGMTVSDLDRAREFYCQVLGFEPVTEVELASEDYERLLGVFGARLRVARLRLGGEMIELTEFLAPRGRPLPPDSRSNDRWFQHVAIITSDMDAAYRHLRAHRVEHISPGPQRLPDWNPNAGGISAFYFRDPDGHPLEVLEFPAGKGLARWQNDDRLFLGIDHTAIAVSDTESSVAFYRDLLGFVVAGASENWGPEQERLNQVFGARLEITALRLPGGPGVELLEYLTPRGRPMPEDAQVNDLFHWQTSIEAISVADLEPRLRAARARLVSPGAVDLPAAELGFGRGLLVRDPDGHVVELRQHGVAP